MSSVNVNQAKAQEKGNVNGSKNAVAAFEQRVGEKEANSANKSTSLLSRMYPALSHEQAAAVIRQQIALEQLRNAARSRRRRRRR